MEKELKLEDTELLCLNIVDTIATYFDKYPKGKITKKDYGDMVGKITKGLAAMPGADKTSLSYVG